VNLFGLITIIPAGAPLETSGQENFTTMTRPLKSQDFAACRTLKLRIYMARAAAIRGIAGDIQKLASLVTAWALIRGPDCADRIVALATSPISQVALRTDIPGEFAGSGKAAQGTFHFLFLGCHLSHLPSPYHGYSSQTSNSV
jgi:hypothetical protein